MALQMEDRFPNEGDAWTYTLDVAHQYFERVLSEPAEEQEVPTLHASLLDMNLSALPQKLQDLIGALYLDIATVLGRRTGELHQALARGAGDPSFELEPFSMLYQRSTYQSMRNLTRRTMQLLQKNLKRLPEQVQKRAVWLVDAEQDVLGVFKALLETRITAAKFRFHGDFHLGQVLRTGKDFFIRPDWVAIPIKGIERLLKRTS